MSLYPFAAAYLRPDDPSLPAIPDEPLCVCGEELLQHNDRMPDGSLDWQIGAGPCQHCPCAGYQAAGVDQDIAAVRAEMRPEYEWSAS